MSVTIVKKRLSERLREKQAEMKKLYHRGYSDIQSLLIEAAEELEKIEKSTSYILTPIGEGAYVGAPKESEYFVMDCFDPFHSKIVEVQHNQTHIADGCVPECHYCGKPIKKWRDTDKCPTVQ